MTPDLTLVIGNKNYSSWSMRPWVALRAAGVPFAERMVKFDSDDWRANISRLSPSGMVPVLWEGEPGRGFATWDTLAIVERAHELFPSNGLWPGDARARARARSLCAEMHSGFRELRNRMPMNLRGRHPGKGMNEMVAKDIARLTGLWGSARSEHGAEGPWLFGAFSAADAYFAPVATRFVTYGVAVTGGAGAWQESLLAHPAVQEWTSAGLLETEFYAPDEPYQEAAARR